MIDSALMPRLSHRQPPDISTPLRRPVTHRRYATRPSIWRHRWTLCSRQSMAKTCPQMER